LVDYLTHYYIKGTPPFRSLSTLPDDEALKLMTALYEETAFGARFKDPLRYLHNRQRTERWVRAEFITKGGQPQEPYPIYMVLGSSPWLVKAAPNTPHHGEIRIPLAVFEEGDVSFTYPDSMISHWFGREKPVEYYQEELHGRVFTLPEILLLVEQKGMPEEAWQPAIPSHLAPYIEAQVWNHARLAGYWRQIQPVQPTAG